MRKYAFVDRTRRSVWRCQPSFIGVAELRDVLSIREDGCFWTPFQLRIAWLAAVLPEDDPLVDYVVEDGWL